MKVVVLGAGSWGTALAQHLSREGVDVILWGRSLEVLNEIKEKNRNYKFFPDVILDTKIRVEADFSTALKDSNIIVLSIPTSATREILERIKETKNDNEEIVIVNTAKGLEVGSNLRLSQVVGEVLKDRKYKVYSLSGPSFVLEVVKGMPTALVLAGNDVEDNRRKEVASLFHRGTLRVYTSNDVVGVELGGVLKNVIAVASGIGDGLGLGLNARAGLLTRGLKEISNLILAEGGKINTVMGLSGLGDLMLTATGELSRNRGFGLLLGRGLTVEEAKVEIGQTIEAITACKCAYELSRKHGIESPIIEKVTEIVTGNITPSEALKGLLMRGQKEE